MKARIVNNKIIVNAGRFDGSYHNADVNIYEDVITSHSSHNLSHYCSKIFTSGRARRVYTRKEYGVPFLSNSDASSSDPFSSCSYSSKKYGYDKSALLKGGMVLTGRVGAIGQTSFVPKYWEKYNAMGSDNIIRIEVKDDERNGFIYAYLASKIGKLSFLKHSTGGVQPFITDKMVGSLPIPDFPEDFQKEVDDLIQESAKLREEAANEIETAKKKIIGYTRSFEKYQGYSTRKILASTIRTSFNCRFDSTYYINSGIDWMKGLNMQTKRLGDCNIKTWYPGIFKRSYVKKGYPYIKGSSLFLNNPFRSCEHLSKTRTPNVDELRLKEGLMLISCAGICGDVKLITKEYEEKEAIGSPDIIRLVSNDKLFTTEYLFAYLQIPSIKEYLQSLKYGSVIERFDTYNLVNVPIVVPTTELSQRVTEIVRQYMDYTYRAFKTEEKAISMVEERIEKWC